MKTWLLGCLLCFAVTRLGQAQEIRWQGAVRHDHRIGSCRGTLRVLQDGINYETENRKHARQWTVLNLEALEIASTRIRVITFDGDHFKFRMIKGEIPSDIINFLLENFRQALVVKEAIPSAATLFEVAVAHRHRRGACQGILRAGKDRIAFQSDKSAHSRTWMYPDVVDIHSMDGLTLTLTSRERRHFHYGGHRVFRFRLKEPLPPRAYHDLWRRVNVNSISEDVTR